MIAYIEGKIIGQGENWVVVKPEGLGVGYKVFCGALDPRVREDDKFNDITFYIHQHIREDANDLYGFATLDTLKFFELLISVSGVGPKMALNISSQLSADNIKNAVIENDSNLFTTISGVGKKLAAKIIIELKNKIDKLGDINLSMISGDNELVETLKSIGFKSAEIQKTIQQIPKNLKTLEEKIKYAIKEIRR
ncbi:MAG: holliday junction DNA helicase RuvA [Candidatus Berkelbacteria bacterium Licking1014_85]|uniref:Holliday junction branch migration complex subunit RuvA n=1 Tax=Candidatus Berkelbacteria bacterium Licking1014_85 TaxID=2017148 RepID=A0A554LLV8_9BACT|nr:MAG: holliday junction DNA helicase RuvA [Candidatus Berkelbacteria bacterium Licking1014_85]